MTRVDETVHGSVEAIFIAPVHGARVVLCTEVLAVAGRGLVGDRHFRKSRDPDARKSPRANAEVTLIEVEALVALERDCHIALEPGAHRRNITCRGVRLSGLVGAPFRVGEVILRGVKLSQPCAHLESLTQPGVVKGLIHRAGLRAEILHGGIIRGGDQISTPRCSRVPHEPVGVSVP